MMADADMEFTCRTCGKAFTLTVAEQEFYQLKGFKFPRHCKECRQIKDRKDKIVCAACGREIEKAEALYCTICNEIMYEQKTEEAEKVVEELRAELLAAKSSSAESLETVKEKDQRISELVQEVNLLHKKINTLSHKVKELSQELETAHQLDAKLSSFQLLFNSLEKELKDIKGTQDLIGSRMVDLISIIHEVVYRTSLWEIIKHRLNSFLKQNIKPEIR